jgi:hypothetical protein
MNYLENIQRFVDLFDKSSNITTLNVTSDFITNNLVFSSQVSLPDLVTKTKLPFDKNSAFWTKKVNSRRQLPKNMFPK